MAGPVPGSGSRALTVKARHEYKTAAPMLLSDRLPADRGGKFRSARARFRWSRERCRATSFRSEALLPGGSAQQGREQIEGDRERFVIHFGRHHDAFAFAEHMHH